MPSQQGSESLTERARAGILEDIIQCRVRPGEMFHLSELAHRYRMSKTPVREALVHLQSAGYVEALPYRGYRVTSLSVQDIEEISTMRILLEGAAAELAATHISDSELAELERLKPPQTAIMNLEYDKYAYTFHMIIAEASGVARLSSLVDETYSDVRRLLFAGLARPQPETVSREHQGIVEALSARNPQLARQRMVEHIERLRDRLRPDVRHECDV